MPEMSMKEFNEKIERWSKDFPEAAAKGLGSAAAEVHKEVIEKHLSGPAGARTLQPRTGGLKNSITFRVKRAGGRLTAEIGNWKNPLPYARIHEYGGMITPKKGNFLVFKIGERFIFTKKVVIPERSYLRSSLRDKRKKIVEMLLSAIKRSYTNA
jgi:phage gpG-like protein